MNVQMQRGPKASELHSLAAIEAFEQTPLQQRYPWDNTYDLIQHACQHWGDDTGLEFLPTGTAGEASETVSYRQLAGRIHQTANLLHSIGVGEQDTVSIMMPSLIETCYALWGGQAAGIISPLNSMLEAHHLAEIMAVTQSRVLVTCAPMDSDPGLWSKVVGLTRLCPQLTHLILVQKPGLTGDLPESPRPDLTLVNYHAVIDQFGAQQLDSGRRFHAHQVAAHMHTGGTTGRPKVAQLTHGNLAFAAQFANDLAAHKPRYNAPCGLPMFHIFALIVTGIAAFVSGRNIVILSPAGFRNPTVLTDFWAHVERYRFQGMAAVPTILAILCEIPPGEHDVSSLEEVVSGAAPLPETLKANFENRYQCWVRNGYGMTETAAILSHGNQETCVPAGSCGLRLPYSERIVAELDGDRLRRVCEAHETGVVLARGPNVFAGYLEPQDNERAWVDGWFNTGDMGYQDEQGFLYLTGRVKDLIIRGGHNIDPLLIEEPLLRHPDVVSAVAIGQPDPHAGELPVVYVVARNGHRLDTDALLDYCHQQIPERAAIPKRIELLNALPLTAVGKLFKPRLREMAATHALCAALSEANIGADIDTLTDPLKGLSARIHLHDPLQQGRARDLLQAMPVAIDYLTGSPA